MNVGQNTSGCNSDASQKLIQLFIVLDGQSDVAGNDTGLLVVAGSVPCQFQNLCTEVF